MTATPPPTGLDARGADLWTRVSAVATLDDAGQVLLEEACRCADRLERLHWLTTGEANAWARLLPDPDDGSQYTLVIGNALSEARQQQQVLRALLGQLKLGRVATETDSAKGGLDDLSARRARRGAASATAHRTPGGQ